jgi:hypothetical protein
VASLPQETRCLVKISMIFGSNSVIRISMVWSGSTSARPERYLSKGLRVYKYQQSLKFPKKNIYIFFLIHCSILDTYLVFPDNMRHHQQTFHPNRQLPAQNFCEASIEDQASQNSFENRKYPEKKNSLFSNSKMDAIKFKKSSVWKIPGKTAPHVQVDFVQATLPVFEKTSS